MFCLQSIPPSSAPSIKTHGKKKMAEPRKDSRTKASEVVAVSSSKHVKEESELHKCLGDDCNDEKLLKSQYLLPISFSCSHYFTIVTALQCSFVDL